ncbi:MAG TPA: hypothetical protein VGD13_15220 [Xanthobacteraceae bacterium]|jgi:hypothetical protein
MNMMTKPVIALGLAGAIALSATGPTVARDFNWGAAGVGFAAGALVGAAAANASSGHYYRDSYAYAPGYAVGPAYSSYGYAPAYSSRTVYVDPGYDSYAAAPAYVVEPRYNYRYQSRYRNNRDAHISAGGGGVSDY